MNEATQVYEARISKGSVLSNVLGVQSVWEVKYRRWIEGGKWRYFQLVLDDDNTPDGEAIQRYCAQHESLSG